MLTCSSINNKPKFKKNPLSPPWLRSVIRRCRQTKTFQQITVTTLLHVSIFLFLNFNILVFVVKKTLISILLQFYQIKLTLYLSKQR